MSEKIGEPPLSNDTFIPGPGTPDAPDFKPRGALFAASLIAYAIWVGSMIIWSLQLHRTK